jgi:uncharacterized protein (DUF58 family)
MRLSKLITVGASAAFILVVGMILNVAQLYWMAGVLLMLPAVGWLYAVLQARGVVLRRRMPAVGRVGETITVELEAANTAPLPKLQVWLVDSPPPSVAPEGRPLLPVHLPPMGRASAGYRARLLQRGRHRFGDVRLVSVDPLGLSLVAAPLEAPAEILVYPRVVPLPERCLPRGAGSQGFRDDLFTRRGEGATFHGVREYQPGDPLRRVHWRSSARWGRLTVVEFDDERSCDLVLALETRRGSPAGEGPENSFEYAVTVAASLASLAAECGYGVRLVAPGLDAAVGSGERGPEDLALIMETLAGVEAEADASLAETLPDQVGEMVNGADLVWITPLPGPETVATARSLVLAGFGVTVLGLERGSFGGEQCEAEEWEATAEQLARAGAGFACFHKQDPVARALELVWEGRG